MMRSKQGTKRLPTHQRAIKSSIRLQSTTTKPKKPQNIKNRYKRLVSNPPRQILSGIQPTGVVHIGNLFGAVTNWVDLQYSEPLNHTRDTLNNLVAQCNAYKDDHSIQIHRPNLEKRPVIYSIVDLHAITIPKPAEELYNSSVQLAATLLGCGIDPSRANIFIQSQVPQHTELAWLLTCNTPISWLYRMTQFKDKATKLSQNEQEQDTSSSPSHDESLSSNESTTTSLDLLRGVNTGLLSYPILMAADMILYNATHVPVGDDQVQHLEFTRDIVRSFNSQYAPIFVEPVPIHNKHATRVMSLRSADSKMSKSDPAPWGKITLDDSDKAIMDKVKRAVTDAVGGVTYDHQRPGIMNLLNIYAASENMQMMQEHYIKQIHDLNQTYLVRSGLIQHSDKLRQFALESIPHQPSPDSITTFEGLSDNVSQHDHPTPFQSAVDEWLNIANRPMPTITAEELSLQHRTDKLSAFKPAVAESLIKLIGPIRERTTELMSRPDHIEHVTRSGAEHVKTIAASTVDRTKEALGMVRW